MTFRDTWHADDDQLDRYASGDIDSARAMSIEAHLPQCDDCRAAIAERADTQRLQATWSTLVDRIDRPHMGVFERALTALGVRETTARLLAATPALRLPFVLSSAAVLLLGVLAGGRSRADGAALGALLLLAPVLPVVGVALAYGRHTDPAYEVTVATPTPGFRLLMVRSVAVLIVTALTGAIAALAVPGADIEAAAWMLPALALTASTLALATVIPVQTAAAALAGGWVVVTVAGLRVASAGLATPRLSLVVDEAVFRSSGQIVCAAIAVVAVAVALLRRDIFESEVSA